MNDTGTGWPRPSTLVLAATTAVALALLVSRVNFVPLWDGRFYAECVLEAARNGLRPYWLRCSGHSSQAYVLFAGIVRWLAPNGTFSFFAVDGLLLVAAGVGFYRLIRLALPSRSLDVERAQATGAFMLQPSFLAAVVQPNIDLPVLAGFVWCLVTLVERRWVWTVLVGLAMVFSKETGVLLYGLTCACYALWLLVEDTRSWRERARAVLRMAPLAVPLVTFVAYFVAYAVFRPTSAPMWEGYTRNSTLVEQFIIPRYDAFTASYLAMIFLLNFAWIPSLAIAGDLAAAFRARFGGRVREAAGLDRRIVALLAIVTIGVAYFLTRYATFTNSRYVLAAVAMLLAMFVIALVRLPFPPAVRRGLLAAYMVLLAFSSVRTIDPVSRLVFGTFPVGAHEMLSMTSITKECCGPVGRDQLAYSLEFTVFDHLVSDAIAATSEDLDSLTIVLPDDAHWYVVERVDRVSRRRTLDERNTRTPRTIVASDAVSDKLRSPSKAWYFALPNQDFAGGLRKLGSLYDIGPERRVGHRGYAMPIYPLVLR